MDGDNDTIKKIRRQLVRDGAVTIMCELYEECVLKEIQKENPNIKTIRYEHGKINHQMVYDNHFEIFLKLFYRFLSEGREALEFVVKFGQNVFDKHSNRDNKDCFVPVWDEWMRYIFLKKKDNNSEFNSRCMITFSVLRHLLVSTHHLVDTYKFLPNIDRILSNKNNNSRDNQQNDFSKSFCKFMEQSLETFGNQIEEVKKETKLPIKKEDLLSYAEVFINDNEKDEIHTFTDFKNIFINIKDSSTNQNNLRV